MWITMSSPWYDCILPVDKTVDNFGTYPHYPQGGQNYKNFHNSITELSTGYPQLPVDNFYNFANLTFWQPF